MCWCLTTQFGYRARDESRKLALGDIKFCKDGDGTRYLEWDIERGTKTRTGERSTSHQRAFNPKAFETGSWQCPVNICEIFISHRPIEANDGNFPFYLAIRPTNAGNIWYFPRPLGKNKLGEFLSKAAPFVNLENLHNKKSRSKVSNHSARKTSITNNSNIHPLHVS